MKLAIWRYGDNQYDTLLIQSAKLQRKNGRAATAAVIAYSFKVYRRLIYLGVPFRVKRGLGKQISFIAAEWPRQLTYLSQLGDSSN